MWLWGIACVSGFGHLILANTGPRWFFYVCKLLTTALLAGLVVQKGLDSLYAQLIAIGLLFSIIGDVFLMQLKDRFLLGLSCFSISHLMYTLGFWHHFHGEMIWWVLALFTAVGILIFFLLLPHLKQYLVPVALYLGLMVQMAWAAGEWWLTSSTEAAFMAFFAVVLFIFSDIAFVMVRVYCSTRKVLLGVSSLYHVAQGLLVASLWLM